MPVNVLDLLEKTGVQVRIASRVSGETHSACPACGGTQRFRVWPAKNDGNGYYACRDCGLHGDNVQFCRDFLGMDFKAAVAWCGREDLSKGTAAPDRRPQPLTMPARRQVAYRPATHGDPPDQWLDRAAKMIEICHQALLANEAQLAWLAGRGIDRAAVQKYRLGWNSGDEKGRGLYRPLAAWGLPNAVTDGREKKNLWLPVGLVIPNLVGGRVLRIRIRRPTSEREKCLPQLKYYVVPGSSMATMVLETARRAFVVVEAELDAMACAAATGDLCGAVSVMTLEGRPDTRAVSILRQALAVLVALDFGDTGTAALAGQRALSWWQASFPDRCRRWPVPVGKDPGDAVRASADLRAWVLAGLPPRFAKAAEQVGPADKSADHAGGSISSVLVKEAAGGFLVPEVVRELAALLTTHPVKIVRADGELRLEWPDKWAAKYRQQAGRISQLVFFDDTVGRYLDRHPHGVISGRNILVRQEAA